jgi:HAMP domain-containing protein
MKLKTFLLLKLLTITLCSNQLFDVLGQELDKMQGNFNQVQSVNNRMSPNIQNQKANTNTNNQDKAEMSIFDAIDFPTKESKDIAVHPTEQHNPVNKQVTSSIRTLPEAKKETQLDKMAKEIEELKTEIGSLAQTNGKLMRKYQEVNASRKPKKNHKSNLVSFIQKYDQDLNSIKAKMQANEQTINSTITKKNDEFNKLYTKATDQFNRIQKKVQTVNNKLEHIQTEHINKIENMKNNLEVSNMKVDTELNAHSANISNIEADNIELPGIKLSNNKIQVKKDTKIEIDGESFVFGDLIKDYSLFQEFLKKCGENFENCQPVPRDVMDEEKKTQQVILDSLRELRQETKNLLLKKQKSFR